MRWDRGFNINVSCRAIALETLKAKIGIPTWSASPIASSAVQAPRANLHASDPQRYLDTEFGFDRNNATQPKRSFYVFRYFGDAWLE